MSIDVKRSGARVLLLGITREELGGSEFARYLGALGNAVPEVRTDETLPLYRGLQQAIDRELIQSCHAVGRGGLAVALARMSLGGRLGLDLDLDRDAHLKELSTAVALFSESAGRLVVTVDPARVSDLRAMLPTRSCSDLGQVVEEPRIRLKHGGRFVIQATMDGVERAFKETFDAI